LVLPKQTQSRSFHTIFFAGFDLLAGVTVLSCGLIVALAG